MVFDQSEEEKSKLLKHKFYIYRDVIRAMKALNNVAEMTSTLFNKR
jgi:hypothetical protein